MLCAPAAVRDTSRLEPGRIVKVARNAGGWHWTPEAGRQWMAAGGLQPYCKITAAAQQAVSGQPCPAVFAKAKVSPHVALQFSCNVLCGGHISLKLALCGP
jgi:hypothetical protein